MFFYGNTFVVSSKYQSALSMYLLIQFVSAENWIIYSFTFYILKLINK